MAYPIEQKLVIAVASSALFDLAESDAVYREQGVEAYRKHQRDREEEILKPGVALPLIKRILSLNGVDDSDHPVDVVLLSRNDSDTGLRVFKSIEAYELGISRAAFVSGNNPFRYANAFNASLFLSANPNDVKDAIMQGLPAGRVFPTKFIDDESDKELRIAFDFDGVIVDDSAEATFKRDGLEKFNTVEREHATESLPVGPLHRFFTEVAKLQQLEAARMTKDNKYHVRVRIAIVTSRNAPAHERVVTCLREWGIHVDETFFLGGIDKAKVLAEFKPHIFFDDQLDHIQSTAGLAPSVHVPFGIANERAIEMIKEAQKPVEGA